MLDFQYTLIRSRRKSIAIRIEPNGGITVRAPNFTPKYIIEHFIRSKTAWIQKHQTRVQNNPKKIHTDREIADMKK
jgi:predicted metal-dependent hydrolase